jgi:siroheme synthase
MKNCSASLAIKEMQIKITLRIHLTPVRIAIIKTTTKNKCWQACREKRNPCTLLVGMTTLENIWRLLKKKLNIHLSYDPAIPLLGIYPKE